MKTYHIISMVPIYVRDALGDKPWQGQATIWVAAASAAAARRAFSEKVGIHITTGEWRRFGGDVPDTHDAAKVCFAHPGDIFVSSINHGARTLMPWPEKEKS